MNITNTITSTIISGSSGNDSIINLADDVTINGGEGDDTIYDGFDATAGHRVLINTGGGNNHVTIQGGSDQVTVLTGDGDNEVGSVSPRTLLRGGAGNDSLTFYTGVDYGTLSGGAGDDVISAVSHNVIVSGGEGNDTIDTFANAYDITINAGLGDDVLNLKGHRNVIEYAEGDGNDTIDYIKSFDNDNTMQYFDGNVALHITKGSIDKVEVVGRNVVMTVGTGSITFLSAVNKTITLIDDDGNSTDTVFSGDDDENTTGNTVISGTNNADYIFNEGNFVTINANSGNDSIISTGENVIINTGAGDNFVSVVASYNTIVTGDGDNILRVDGRYPYQDIRFGNGKNSLITSNAYATIIGGSSGEGVTLHNGSNNSYVDVGEGNDVVAIGVTNATVKGGAGDDSINLYRDANNSVIEGGKGNDIITLYSNENPQTFRYAGGDGYDLIKNFSSEDTIKIRDITTFSSVVSGDDLILNFNEGAISLEGAASLEAVNIVYETGWASIEGGGYKYFAPANNMIADSLKTHFATFTLSGESIEDEDNDGVPDGATVSAFIYNDTVGVMVRLDHVGGEVTLNGEVGVSGDDEFIVKFDTAGEISGLEGFDGMIAGSGKLTINDLTATLNSTLTAVDETAVINALRKSQITVSDTSTVSDVFGKNHTVNVASNTEITASGILVGYGDQATLTGSSGDDVLIAKASKITLTGGAGKDTFTCGLDAERITITDYTEDDVILVGDTNIIYYIKDNDFIAVHPNDSRGAVVKGGANMKIAVSDDSGNVVYYGNYMTITDSNDATVTATSKVLTVDASSRTKKVILKGNAKANTIIGGTGNTTMTGGKGADTFIHSGGNDYITDYTAGTDTINLGSSTITGFDVVSDNLILTTSKGNISIKGGVGKEITLIDSTGQVIKSTYVPTVPTGLVYSSAYTKFIAHSSFAEEIIDLSKYVSVVKTVDASRLTKAVDIVGNNNSNSLKGGSGDDTLTAGAGQDTFIFNAAGNANITDYSSQLTLKLTTKLKNFEERIFNDENFNSNELDDILANDKHSDMMTGLYSNEIYDYKPKIDMITVNKNKNK